MCVGGGGGTTVEVKGISQRIAGLKQDMNRGKVIRIIHVFTPTNVAFENEAEKFYDIETTLEQDRVYRTIAIGTANQRVVTYWLLK